MLGASQMQIRRDRCPMHRLCARAPGRRNETDAADPGTLGNIRGAATSGTLFGSAEIRFL